MQLVTTWTLPNKWHYEVGKANFNKVDKNVQNKVFVL
jgi:hypothetical protein